MKRAPFLGASAAVLLSGCGGSHIMRALPGVAPSLGGGSSNPASTALQLVPATADPIPETVLTHPIIGEARRFDGTTPPSNWMFAQGQTLNIADNRPLFGVLGAIAGGDGKTTFKLPNAKFGLIVAVAGQLMTSPDTVAQSGRRMSARDSLGPGATPRLRRAVRSASPQTVAEQRLIASAIRAGTRVVPLSPELAGRIDRAEQDTRTAVLGALGAASRARLDAAIRSIVAGRSTIAEESAAMAATLSGAEAPALVRMSDAFTQQFDAAWAGNDGQHVQLDAAQFLFSIALTRDQAHTIAVQSRRRR